MPSAPTGQLEYCVLEISGPQQSPWSQSQAQLLLTVLHLLLPSVAPFPVQIVPQRTAFLLEVVSETAVVENRVVVGSVVMTLPLVVVVVAAADVVTCGCETDEVVVAV